MAACAFIITDLQVWHNTPVSIVLKNLMRVRAEADAALVDCSKPYDCSVTALHSMQKTETGERDAAGNMVLRQLVVFTAGECNHSTVGKLAELVQEIAKPGFANFQYVCMVAGAKETAKQMTRAFAFSQHAKVRV